MNGDGTSRTGLLKLGYYICDSHTHFLVLKYLCCGNRPVQKQLVGPLFLPRSFMEGGQG